MNENNYFTIDYGEYKRITHAEKNLIRLYWIDFNVVPITNLLRNNAPITPGMKAFIADVMEGKIKPKRGQKPQTIRRDLEILKAVDNLMKEASLPLTSGRNDGAAAIVAKENNMTDDAVIKACDRARDFKALEFIRRFGFDAFLDK